MEPYNVSHISIGEVTKWLQLIYSEVANAAKRNAFKHTHLGNRSFKTVFFEIIEP